MIWKVIIESDSGRKREVREVHDPGVERNLHGHVRCRVGLLASPRPSTFARTRRIGYAMSEVMGQAYNTKLHMRGQFLLI